MFFCLSEVNNLIFEIAFSLLLCSRCSNPPRRLSKTPIESFFELSPKAASNADTP